MADSQPGRVALHVLSDTTRGGPATTLNEVTKQSGDGMMLQESASDVLAAMNAHPLGRDAALIGTVTIDSHWFVQIASRVGGHRIVDRLSGEPVPRIC